MTIFEGITLAGLTPSVLLGLAILMLFTGKLWTNSAYQQKVQEAENWKAAYETEREARAQSDAQTAELLEVAQTTQQIVAALFGATERARRSGGADVAISAKE